MLCVSSFLFLSCFNELTIITYLYNQLTTSSILIKTNDLIQVFLYTVYNLNLIDIIDIQFDILSGSLFNHANGHGAILFHSLISLNYN